MNIPLKMRRLFQDTTPDFWFRLGTGAGAAGVCFFVAAYFAISGHDVFKYTKETIRDWQTLTAGLIALFGAWLTVVAIERQIQLARGQEEDRRERKQFADRTALPSALVALCDYAKASISVLMELRTGLTPNGRIIFPVGWMPPEMPAYPHEALGTLRTCIETTEIEKRTALAKILRDLQIQNSRLLSAARDVSPGSTTIVVDQNLSTFLVNSLDLYVRCNSTIVYARGDASFPPSAVYLADLQTAAFFEDIHEADYPLVYEQLRATYEQRAI